MGASVITARWEKPHRWAIQEGAHPYDIRAGIYSRIGLRFQTNLI